ncbi:MAG: thiol reductant ABC exporter subunit CydD [Anaerolineales bacterium]
MHRRLLQLARDSRLALTLTILAGLLGGLLTIGQAALLSQVISRVFLDSQTLPTVLDALLLMLAVIALRGLVAWGGAAAATAVAVRVKTDLRQRLFAHLLKLGPAYARGERAGELANAAAAGVEALDAYFSQYLPQLAVSALVPLAILIVVFPLDPLSGLVLLLTAPLIPVFMILIGKAAEALTKRQYETLSRLSAHFLDSLQGLTTLKLFGAGKSHAKTIDEVNRHFRDTTLSVLRVTFLSALALELIATLSTAVVAVEVGIRLLYGNLAFQQALFLLVLAPEFYIPLRMLGLRYHAGMSGVTAARRIFEILDTRLPVNSVQCSVNSDQFSLNTEHCLLNTVFHDVSFTYPGEAKPAIQHINFEIKPGQHTALVGPSGAGKSTLVNLLLRFAEPGAGRITVNGAALASIPPDEWRRQVAWVSQKPFLFHDTIAANIRLAKPDASDAEVAAAARAARLHDFIQSLPAGYETVVSEGGARLSGGEAQRLALARAFLKDAPILILDEPTSSLDPRQEALLEDSVRRIMQGRTVLTIAHRLNTIFRADQIIVLDEGRIVESGTHAQLMNNNGIYSRLVGAYAGETEYEIRNTDNKQWTPAGDTPTAMPAEPIPSHHPSTVLRLLGFLNGSWRWVAASVFLGAATIASSVALMGTSAWLISAAALHPSIADLAVAIVGVRFFGIARGVFRYLERLVSHRVTFRLLARLRTWFYTALEPLAPARLMQYRSGDLLARVVADVETLENFYVRVVSPPLAALVVAAATAFALGLFDPLLGWALLGFLFALGVFAPLLAQALGRGPGRALIARRADLHVQLVDGIQGMADLLAFGRQDDRNRSIEQTGADYARLQRRMGWISGLNDGLGVLLTNLGLWTILVLAIPRVAAGEIPGVTLAALALMTAASFEAVTPLPLAAQLLGSSLEAAQRLFDVVDAEPVISKQFSVVSEKPEPVVGQVAFRDVRFSYGEGLALNGISFQLDEGRSLAIVGPSGAGKSTLVNLLLRFWDYEQGEITLAGRALKSFTEDEARRKLAVVAQNAYFFNATIRQNLLLADPQATQAQIEAAAQQAQIHDFIAGLPQGYETWIGEQGLRLSGGERQRLAIARALLKDAPILVLDEPTANLDPLTERALMGALFAAMQGRTTLMITHRIVGLERFDGILVLDRGRIVERGSHAGLLAQNGLYRQLWTIQNRILSENLPG